jgi:hypothetical protein
MSKYLSYHDWMHWCPGHNHGQGGGWSVSALHISQAFERGPTTSGRCISVSELSLLRSLCEFILDPDLGG